ncbi:MAG TPA: hypothetical protein CFH81_08900 [Sulfurovum sp. UBA12169]|nr:MAG TPA: hypothetical protein CFH81_08900 [Sulfurovum sp. UBA12169]
MYHEEVIKDRIETRIRNIADMLCLVGPDINNNSPIEFRLDSIIDHLGDLIEHEFSISHVARLCGKHKDTIRNFLLQNYAEGKGYRLSPKGGKIYIARDAALSIRRHYAK